MAVGAKAELKIKLHSSLYLKQKGLMVRDIKSAFRLFYSCFAC